MKSKNLSFLGILLLLLFVTACEGPQGDTGPIGPQGDTGPQGVTGPQGEPGTPNVISKTLTPDLPPYFDWIWWWGTKCTYDIFDEELIEEIVNTGIVLVYVEFADNTGVWNSLPWLSLSDEILSFTFEKGIITLTYVHPGENDCGIPVTKIRYLLIPSAESLDGRIAESNYSDLSYDEVMSLLKCKGK